jgi:hypothetical protein
MPPLSLNWFVESPLDFEHKQYLLLAYLQQMQRLFEQTKVYPALAELITHHRNLESYHVNKTGLLSQFPQRVVGIDLAEAKLQFVPELEDDAIVQEIDSIVHFALPRVREHVEAGRELYDIVDAQLRLYPIGVVPLYQDEGYFLLRAGGRRDVHVFEYSVTLFEAGPDQSRGITTRPLTTFTYTLSSTYETMKLELLRQHPAMPNPATFALESELEVPLAETLLPIAKRRLLRAVQLADGHA